MTGLAPAFALTLFLAAAADDLTVLDNESADGKPSQLLYRNLQKQSHTALDRRRQEYEKLKTPEQIREYQQRLRRRFVESLGGFPNKSALNAKVTGRIDRGDHVIEKVLFDSRPNHHITANLYRPKTKPPYPAVVVASGHSRTGKAAGYNQRFGIIMAKHGMAALVYDPIGQGERSQFLDKDGNPRHRGTTTEHFLVGISSILVGRNTASYRVWDGMRCIDYLESRKDINAKRIGFTGCSGGGTQTSYMMALDPRVTCAAPACYLTTFRRLIDTIGPQDAEQNIFGQLSFGMDHPDYVIMRAPKPTLISCTTKDFFSIDGTWDNFRQSKRIYTKLGHPERVDLVEGDGGHGVPMGNLNRIATWMQRWLLDKHEPIHETEIDVLPTKDLQCTPKGQVLLLPGEQSVVALNAHYAESLNAKRTGGAGNPTNLRKTVRQLAGIRSLKDIPKPTIGRTDVAIKSREGYGIVKLTIQRKQGIPLPALLFIPIRPGKKARRHVTLYLHGGGKAADAGPGGDIEKLVKQGHDVLAVDLSGLGETRRSEKPGQLGDWKNFYMAYLLGKSLVGIRAEDALTAARQLQNLGKGKAPKVHLVGIGEAAIPALHAAALETDLFETVTLRGMVPSWSRGLGNAEAENQLVNTVHGALTKYDLPMLMKLIGARKLTVKEPATVDGKK